jgi:hypothetical protein
MSVGEVAQARNPENPTKLSALHAYNRGGDDQRRPAIKGQRNRGTGAPAPTPSGENTYRSTLAPGASGAKASRKNDFPER